GPGVAAASGQGDHPGARTERARGGPWPWSEFTWPRADAWDDPDDPWRAATRGTGPPPAAEPAEATEPPPAAKPMAKKAVKPKVATPPQAPSAE
ncbi:MAG TPA: hypothetical protein VFM54_22035, partial [Micromonosporaceae bacterium]|nr:hypothetical protein [Micromonosporaceae bacterium]